MTNLIYAVPGFQIIALAPYYGNAGFYYFSNFMGLLDHDLYYVLGEQLNQDGMLSIEIMKSISKRLLKLLKYWKPNDRYVV